MEPKFIVIAWSSRSEASYVFGPFDTESQAETFEEGLDRGNAAGRYRDTKVRCLNHPATAFDGTAVDYE